MIAEFAGPSKIPTEPVIRIEAASRAYTFHSVHECGVYS